MSLPDNARQQLVAGLRDLNIAPCTERIDTLLDYAELLLKWNETYNLIAKSDIGSMVSRHLLDSLAVLPWLSGDRIVDVGSGAGLPGIPLAIFDPQRQFLLVDSNGKKTRFLFQIKTTLKLGNIRVENCRIEHYQSPEQIDIVMWRAVASLADMVAWSQHLLEDRGKLIALKGQFPQEEIDSLPAGYAVTNIRRLEIPGNHAERHLIEVMRSQQ